MSINLFGFTDERVLCLLGAIPLGLQFVMPSCSASTGSCAGIWVTLIIVTAIAIVLVHIYTSCLTFFGSLVMISLLVICILSLPSLQKPTMTQNLCCPRLGLTICMWSLMFGVFSLLLYSTSRLTSSLLLLLLLLLLLFVLLWFGRITSRC